MLLNHLALSAVCVLAMLVLDYMIQKSDILEKRMKRFFRLTILFTMLMLCAEAGTSVAELLPPEYRALHILCNVVGFGASPFIPLLLAFAFCNRYDSFFRWPVLPAAANLLVTVASPLFGGIFTVSQQNEYARGDWYALYVASYLAGLAFLFYETRRLMHRYQNKNRCTVALLFLFLLCGTSLQLILPQLRTTWFCVTLALPIYYGYFCELSEKYDVLTELFNRRAYECEVQELEHQSGAGILLLDVDDFKQINDTKGHPYGDFCLYEISKEIRNAFQGLGVCYRIGGDEFCVVANRRVTEAELLAALEALQARLAAGEERGAALPSVTAGYAFYPKDAETVSKAIQTADRRLYENKRGKKHAAAQ